MLFAVAAATCLTRASDAVAQQAAARQAAAGQAAASLPVRCSAAEFDDRLHSSHAGQPLGAVELVVRGVARRQPRADANEGGASSKPADANSPSPPPLDAARRSVRHEYVIEVDKVVYGWSSAKQIRCRSFHLLGENQPLLIALTETLAGESHPAEVKYVAPGGELAAHQSLADARWHWHVLGARGIFVGRIGAAVGSGPPAAGGDKNGGAANGQTGQPPASPPVPSAASAPAEREKSKREVAGKTAENPRATQRGKGRGPMKPAVPAAVRGELRSVAIEKWIGEPLFPAETKLLVDLDDIAAKGSAAPAADVTTLNFVARVEQSPSGGPPIMHVGYRVPVELVDEALAALKRRDEFSVVSGTDELAGEKFVEIRHRGPLADALLLLGATHDACVLLGRARLESEPAEAKRLLEESVRSQLTSATLTLDAARRQARQIETLAMLEHRRVDGAAGRLLDELLTSIAAGQASAPKRAYDPALLLAPDQLPSEFNFDANHSLVWLAKSLYDTQTARRFGSRLKQLAATGPDSWRDELRQALIAARVDELTDRDAAAERMRTTTPVRSSPGLWHDGRYALAFSPSGRWLASAGEGLVRLWSTSDWSRKSEGEFAGEIESAVFCDDDRQLWIAGRREGHGLLAKWNWETGEVTDDRSAGLAPVDSLSLSLDGRTVVATSGEDEEIYYWREGVGGEAQRLPLGDGATHVALSVDGGLVLREDSMATWRVDPLAAPGAPKPPLANPSLPIFAAVFAPDGKTVYTIERPADPAGDAEDSDNPEGRSGLRSTVAVRRASGKFELLGPRSREVDGHQLLISRSGNRLVVVAQRETAVVFTVLDAPSLRFRSRFLLPITDELKRLESAAVSPDGAVLAVAVTDQPPVLFNMETGERLAPGKGHHGRITSVAFSDDGRSLTTVGEDGWECNWDAATLKIAKRKLLGANEAPVGTGVAVRSPLDGQPLEDGRSMLKLQVDPRGRHLDVIRVDMVTGRSNQIGEAQTPWLPDGPRGLVPGGKFFHAGTQIYDRTTLKLVSEKRLRGDDVLKMAFSADGSRYAVVTRRLDAPSDLEAATEEATCWVRVHETATGKTLGAFPTSDEAVNQMAFSPTADRVAVVRGDNILEVWPVPAP